MNISEPKAKSLLATCIAGGHAINVEVDRLTEAFKDEIRKYTTNELKDTIRSLWELDEPGTATAFSAVYDVLEEQMGDEFRLWRIAEGWK